MTIELSVAHCPGCGNVFQRNLRNLCSDCSAAEDMELNLLEQTLRRNRQLSNEQLAEVTSITVSRIHSLIRRGKLKLYDYPNLADACDLCEAPVRQGKLCAKCVSRLRGDIAKDLEQRNQKKEHVFLSKSRR